ncbi:hypothetical protein L6R52_30250 [Myxococcota bacterium]|nr:hypothetical protein [Myxococcota bacterium]
MRPSSPHLAVAFAVAFAPVSGACGFREVVPEGACFAYIVTSDSHTCGRRVDGSLWCWGSNAFGQLGTGDTEPRTEPTRVDALGDEVAGIYLPTGSGAISSRTAFTCARKTDGTLWCFGNNQWGQLGTGDTTPRSVPTKVGSTDLGADVHAASLGSGFACVRKNDDTIWCWGANESGQLGTGDTEPRPTPVQVAPDVLGSGVRYLSTGDAHACARMLDGRVLCWGANPQGQLGTGDTEPRLVPTPISTPELSSDAGVIVTGATHTCATRTDAALFCWGGNQLGQLGVGDTERRLVPTRVELTDLAAEVPLVTAGGRHTCVAKIDGTLWCFGDNRAGQLGRGDRENASRPVAVEQRALGREIAVIYAGGANTCARTQAGLVWCWGANDFGQLGIGSGPGRTEPELVTASCGAP